MPRNNGMLFFVGLFFSGWVCLELFLFDGGATSAQHRFCLFSWAHNGWVLDSVGKTYPDLVLRGLLSLRVQTTVLSRSGCLGRVQKPFSQAWQWESTNALLDPPVIYEKSVSHMWTLCRGWDQLNHFRLRSQDVWTKSTVDHKHKFVISRKKMWSQRKYNSLHHLKRSEQNTAGTVNCVEQEQGKCCWWCYCFGMQPCECSACGKTKDWGHNKCF